MRGLPNLLLGLSAACVLMANSNAQAFRAAGEASQFPPDTRVVWPDGEIRYEVSDHFPSGLTTPAAVAALWDGLSEWNAASCSSLRFVEEGVTASHALPGDGRNTIEWIEVGWEERGFAGDAAAVSDVQYAGVGDDWRIAEADLYLNAQRFQWSPSGDASHKSIRAVAIHEGGHLLGLAHPCEPESGLEVQVCDASFDGIAMHPLYDAALAALSADDSAGVCALYPACSAETCGEGQQCTELGCRALCGISVCDADEICLGDACVGACRSAGCVCEGSADCDAAFACVEAECTPGSAPPGDPCTLDSECAAGVCRGAAGCAFACDSADDCPGGMDECLHGVCQQGQKAYGDPCEFASECTSGLCMSGVAATAVCTRPCEARPTNTCPSGWSCAPVDGQSVCLGPETRPEEGCSVASAPSRSDSAPLPIGLFCVLGATAAIRRRYQV